MASKTHVNTFITEFEDAYKEAAGAIDDFYNKAKALVEKYKGEIEKTAPAVGKAVSEAEAEAESTDKASKSKS